MKMITEMTTVKDTPSRRDVIRLLMTSSFASLAFALGGCGSGGSRTATRGIQGPTGRFGDLQFTASIFSSVSPSFEDFYITFGVQNVGTSTQVLTRPVPEFDMQVIRPSDGAVLWQMSKEKTDPPPSTQAPTQGDTLTLNPGDGHAISATWNTRDQQGNVVPPGDYVVAAWSLMVPDSIPADKLGDYNIPFLLGAPMLHITVQPIPQ